MVLLNNMGDYCPCQYLPLHVTARQRDGQLYQIPWWNLHQGLLFDCQRIGSWIIESTSISLVVVSIKISTSMIPVNLYVVSVVDIGTMLPVIYDKYCY